MCNHQNYDEYFEKCEDCGMSEEEILASSDYRIQVEGTIIATVTHQTI